MTEQKIHSLIRTELQTQYEQAKQKWLRNLSFDTFDWEPDWDWLRMETCLDVGNMRDPDGQTVDDFLYSEYGDDYEAVMAGHVFQVWESMIEGFEKDIEDTQIDLNHDGTKSEWERVGCPRIYTY